MLSVVSGDFIEAVEFVAKFAVKAARRDDLGSRCVLENRDGRLYLSTSAGGLGAKYSVEAEGDVFESLSVSAFALNGAADMLKKTKSEKVTLGLDGGGGNLVVKSGKSRTKIPVFPADAVYNLPEPNEEDWKIPSERFATAVTAAKSFTSQAAVGFRPFELVTVDDSNISIIESGVGIFFSHDSPIEISTNVDYKHFCLIFDEIDRCQFTDRLMFFGFNGNWCVIPRNSKPVKHYKPLLSGLQKTRKAAISLNVVAILELKKQISAMMKIDSSVDSSADLTTVSLGVNDEKELVVSTQRTSTSIEMTPIISDGLSKPRRVGVGFFHGLSHSSFLGEDDSAIVEFGDGVISARSSRGVIFAGLQREC